MKIYGILSSLFLAACLAACAHRNDEGDMLSLAKNYAVKSGCEIEGFSTEVVDRGRKEVEVIFTGTPSFGNWFTVYVNKKSGECRIMEGR
jgi:hypothetical protein